MNSDENKTNEDMIRFLNEVGKLKDTPRRGWLLKGIASPEKVAGHMYRMAITAAFSLKHSADIDMNKVLRLCLVHDIAECVVGDITPHDGISEDEKHRMERETVAYLSDLLPHESQQRLLALYEEYEKKETKEAKLTKDLDRFDMILQAFEYEKSEFKDNCRVAPLEEFFNFETVVNKVENEEVKAMVAEVLRQRNSFLASASDETAARG